MSFMEDPDNPKNGLPPAPPSPEEEWANLDGTQYLNHLTDSNFDEFVKKKESVLVMFYAPCKFVVLEKPRRNLFSTNLFGYCQGAVIVNR